MSTYKNLIGKDVNFLTTDPDNEQAEGQIWYNSTAGVFKDALSNKAWSSGANMITGRRLFASSTENTQSSAWGAGGYIDGTGDTNATEEYNGSGFSTGGNLTTARREFDGAGSLTAGLAMGGRIGPSQQRTETEEYNGTSWSEQNDLNNGRQRGAGAGRQTAGLYFGGIGDTDATEEYNGTSWTAGGDLSTGRTTLGGSGTQTAGLACGGNPYTNVTEEYNGSSWTSGGNLNTTRKALKATGIQTASLAFGGLVPPSGARTTANEEYDGSSWTTSPASLATARGEGGRAGTTAAGLCFGGYIATGVTSATEEYNNSVTVVTGAAWASGGNLSTGRYYIGSTGTPTAGMVFDGYTVTAYSNAIEEYDGTSWTGGVNPPKVTAAVCVPAALNLLLIAGISFTSDQDVPLYSSTIL